MTRIPQRRPRLLVLFAAVGLLLAGCFSTVTTADTGRDSADPDPGTGHLHGLGVDPADGTVHAAGHHGVFRLDGGKVTRVAGRYQDTMGFTVTGPFTFLASGHPAPADPDARSPHPGLIRSTDAGRTWQTLSAEGEADFHALVQAGEVLCGFDSQSGKLWAGTDGGRSWDRRAQLQALDLAAHPAGPTTVWAATGTGLERSTDGGRIFRPASSAPGLVAVEEPRSGLLVGLSADGRVLTGSGGGPWTRLGRLPASGEATVLTAVSTRRLLAADTTGTVYESADGGRTWKVLHRPGASRKHPWPYTPMGYMVPVVGPLPATPESMRG